jgi:hypothetical protein
VSSTRKRNKQDGERALRLRKCAKMGSGEKWTTQNMDENTLKVSNFLPKKWCVMTIVIHNKLKY